MTRRLFLTLTTMAGAGTALIAVTALNLSVATVVLGWSTTQPI